MELVHASVEMANLKSGRQDIQVEVDAKILSPKSVEQIRMLETWVDFLQLFEICATCFDHIHAPTQLLSDATLCPYTPYFVSLFKKINLNPNILGCVVFHWSVVSLSRNCPLRGRTLCLY